MLFGKTFPVRFIFIVIVFDQPTGLFPFPNRVMYFVSKKTAVLLPYVFSRKVILVTEFSSIPILCPIKIQPTYLPKTHHKHNKDQTTTKIKTLEKQKARKPLYQRIYRLLILALRTGVESAQKRFLRTQKEPRNPIIKAFVAFSCFIQFHNLVFVFA